MTILSTVRWAYSDIFGRIWLFKTKKKWEKATWSKSQGDNYKVFTMCPIPKCHTEVSHKKCHKVSQSVTQKVSQSVTKCHTESVTECHKVSHRKCHRVSQSVTYVCISVEVSQKRNKVVSILLSNWSVIVTTDTPTKERALGFSPQRDLQIFRYSVQISMTLQLHPDIQFSMQCSHL